MSVLDLRNQTFGRLTVLRVHPVRTAARKLQWVCRCVCGATIIATTGNLNSGNTQSCGCFHKDRAAQANTTHGHTVDYETTPEYRSYRAMLDRCADVTNENYGGRGITVCRRWLGKNGFENFLADMGPRPARNYSIERVDNNKGYIPSNCVWATRRTQNKNRRGVTKITYRGETLTLSEWAVKLGINYFTLHTRYTVAGDRGAQLFRPT